jgi:hypothetical protein
MPVKMWRSTDRNAPVLSGTQGKMCDLLNTVLITGYPTTSVTVSRVGSIATVTHNSHGFINGQTVTISGANELDYNGNQVITNCQTNSYDYTVSNNPATPATGTVLDGGETTQGTPSSVTRTGVVVTVNLVAHGYVVGNRTRITGANEVGYNGKWTIATATTDSFTYVIPTASTPTTPATGTILVRNGVESAGWTNPFSAANKKVFKQGVSGSKTQAIVRINETISVQHAYGAGILMAESATGIDSFANSCFATEAADGTGMWKSSAPDATARPWVIVGDNRTIIILVKPGFSYTSIVDAWHYSYLGDAISYVPNDIYPQICSVGYKDTGGNGANFFYYPIGQTIAQRVTISNIVVSWRLYAPGINEGTASTRFLRNHLGAVGNMWSLLTAPIQNILETTYGTQFSTMGANGVGSDSYPDPVHGGINLTKINIFHWTTTPNVGAAIVRGHMRGIWCPLHRWVVMAGWLPGDTFAGSGDLVGKTFEVFKLYYNANTSAESWLCLETSDTWDA